MLERTRTADDQKVAFYYNIFPRDIAGAVILRMVSRERFLIFFTLSSASGSPMSLTEICAVGTVDQRDRKAAELLGSDLILLKQLHFSDDEQPIFYSGLFEKQRLQAVRPTRLEALSESA